MNLKYLTILITFISTSIAQTPPSGKGTSSLIESKKAFWKQIYADIDSSRSVIFDKSTLHIYAVVNNSNANVIIDSVKMTVRRPANVIIKQGRKEFIKDAILRAAPYQFVVDSLKTHNLHPNLRWLPVLESGYLDTMISDQNARGIWQFIPPTAAKYGLSVGEIADPHKSTSAFVHYMSSLYRQFGNYPLALTAYHHGEGGIRDKLKKNSAVSLEGIIPSLGFQSGNYYARYLAIVDIAQSLTADIDNVKTTR